MIRLTLTVTRQAGGLAVTLCAGRSAPGPERERAPVRESGVDAYVERVEDSPPRTIGFGPADWGPIEPETK